MTCTIQVLKDLSFPGCLTCKYCVPGADLAFFQGGGGFTQRRCGASSTSRVAASQFFVAILMSEPRSGEPIFVAILMSEPHSGEPNFFVAILMSEPHSGEPIFFAILMSKPRSGEPIFWCYFEPP